MTDTPRSADLKADAAAAGDSVRDRATEAADKARHTASDLSHDLKAEARSRYESAKSLASDRTAAAKDSAASQVSRLASALKDARSDLEPGSIGDQVFDSAADTLSGFASSIQGKSIGTIMNDVSEFGRRNPAAFLGGAVLVGFAIARFAKASTPGTDYGSGSYGRSVYGRDSYAPEATRPDPADRVSAVQPAPYTPGDI